MKIEITDAQLAAIINMTDELSATIGTSDDGISDKNRIKWVRLVDRMLKKNGFKREYK